VGNLFYRVGERREWKEGTEGMFYHRDTESTEFRNKKIQNLKIKPDLVWVTLRSVVVRSSAFFAISV
jgi:hypothetical protein